ncbi:probable DNA-directed RNA polymerase I subunit RPA43, partial [Chironomus tepperi]
MVLVVKCLICQKELTYSQSNPVDLIEHMKIEHPFKRKSKQTVNKETESSFDVNEEGLKKVIDKSVQTDQLEMASGSQHEYLSHLYNQNSTRLSNGSGSYESFADETKDNLKKSSQDRKEIPHEKPNTSRKDRPKMIPESSRTRLNEHEEVSNERQKLLKKDKRNPKKFYKTSIERWRPIGDEKINCPRCSAYKRPTVKTQRQHVTDSSIVSSFLMTCWPLCFSPCYLPTP